jgi:hypothetical protein
MVKTKRPTQRVRRKIARNKQQTEFEQRAQEIGIELEDNRVFYTTSRGVRVECLPVAHVIETATNKIRAEYVEENPEPDLPTRKIEGVGGTAVETAYTDEQIAKLDPNDPDNIPIIEQWQEHALWDARLKQRTGAHVIRTIAIIGTRYDMPEDDEWLKDAEYIGLELPDPDNTRDMRLFYFTTFVVGNRDDGYVLSQGIYAASGFNEALTATVEATFRPPVGRAARADDQSDSGTSQEEGQE